MKTKTFVVDGVSMFVYCHVGLMLANLLRYIGLFRHGIVVVFVILCLLFCQLALYCVAFLSAFQ